MFSTGKWLSTAVAVLLAALSVAAYFSTAPGPLAESPATRERLARGRYLVEQVAMCGDCHSPKDEKGQPITGKTFQGAPILLKPSVPIPGWAAFAPPIAGLPGYTDKQAIKFLTTGKTVSGHLSAPPMPSYRFNEDDASAVVAFLRTFPQASK